jgi:hypothetical protein
MRTRRDRFRARRNPHDERYSLRRGVRRLHQRGVSDEPARSDDGCDRDALVLAIAVSGTAAAGVKLDFRLSNQLPASHHISKGIVLFANKVKEYLKGAVEVKVFDSAQIDKDTDQVFATIAHLERFRAMEERYRGKRSIV